MLRVFVLLLFTGSFFNGYTQDLTGVWQGHFRSSGPAARSSVWDDRYKFEVQIAQDNKLFKGVTYSYLSTVFYGKAAATGTVNVNTGKVMLQEGKLLEVRNQFGDVCIMTCFLQYTKSGEEEFLEGSYVSMNVRDSSNCGRGTVFLRKVPTSDFYTEPFVEEKEKEIASSPPVAKAKPPVRKPATTTARPGAGTTAKTTPKPGGAIAKTTPSAKTTPKAGATTPRGHTGGAPKHNAIAKTEPPVKNPPKVAQITMPKQDLRTPSDSSTSIGHKFATITPKILQSRANPVVKALTIHTNEVILNIYDDGAIDHDTVSVYLDNKLVIDRAMLTDRPLVVTLHLDESNAYHELVMVAENEGEIPPNTSLMIVKAGDKEYEVRITSTEQKNAVVTFKYEKSPG